MSELNKPRYDIQPRAFDGRYVLWERITPPPFISMEWRAIFISEERKAAFKHMWSLVEAQHRETPE